MRRFGIGLVAAAAVAILAACSSPGRSADDAALPDELALPLAPNQDCGCVEGGQCAVTDQRPGHSEVRSLSCAWVRPGEIARCRYESRFVEWGGIHPAQDGNQVLEPAADPWQPGTLRARRLDGGRWCAL